MHGQSTTQVIYTAIAVLYFAGLIYFLRSSRYLLRRKLFAGARSLSSQSPDSSVS